MRQVVLFAVVVAVFTGAISVESQVPQGQVSAAPAPFPPRKVRPKVLTDAVMTGVWEVNWGTVECRMELSKGGTYTCMYLGAVYTGTWHVQVDKGVPRLWIRESTRPWDPNSWSTYAVALDPLTLEGPIEVGSTGVRLKFTKPDTK